MTMGAVVKLLETAASMPTGALGQTDNSLSFGLRMSLCRWAELETFARSEDIDLVSLIQRPLSSLPLSVIRSGDSLFLYQTNRALFMAFSGSFLVPFNVSLPPIYFFLSLIAICFSLPSVKVTLSGLSTFSTHSMQQIQEPPHEGP